MMLTLLLAAVILIQLAVIGVLLVRRGGVAQAREQAMRSAEELRAILQASPNGIAVIRGRHFEVCNAALETLYGYGHGEMIGQPTRIVYPSDEVHQTFGAAAYAAVKRGEIFIGEEDSVKKNGEHFWIRLVAAALDKTDPNTGLVAVFEDVTERRAAEQEMRRARELAEEAARTKTDFLANMSHELRTPLNAILGMSYLALKTELTPRQQDYMAKIQHAGQHLIDVIDDILDFSKIETGQLRVERAQVDLNRVLETAIAPNKANAAAKGLDMVVDVALDVPRNLIGDPGRLGRILNNYLTNAVKFTEAGGIAIAVRVVEDHGTDLMLKFDVTDTGIGLTRDQIANLFQSFVQVDTSTTRKFGGLGLGLVISKRLAELMGGSVGVESEPDKGSTFWFTARLHRGEQRWAPGTGGDPAAAADGFVVENQSSRSN